MIDRSVELGGIYNMRDLGGLPAAGGRMVRRGLLYRASSLHRLDDEQAWGDFDAKCVIDLRYDREREAFPLPEFISDFLHAPILPDHWKSDEEARKLPADQYLVAVYHEMLELGGDAIRAILDTLAFGDSYPAVFFCMAGKDRTGIVTAMLLDILGVEHETIAADYHLTTENMKPIIERIRNAPVYKENGLAYAPDWIFSSDPETMLAFLERMTEKYGNAEGWALQRGLTQREIDAIREHLLES